MKEDTGQRKAAQKSAVRSRCGVGVGTHLEMRLVLPTDGLEESCGACVGVWVFRGVYA